MSSIMTKSLHNLFMLHNYTHVSFVRRVQRSTYRTSRRNITRFMSLKSSDAGFSGLKATTGGKQLLFGALN